MKYSQVERVWSRSQRASAEKAPFFTGVAPHPSNIISLVGDAPFVYEAELERSLCEAE
jgi:hypothetical protein